MQLARSRIIKGTSWRFRLAATARPDGPAPTITGPLTQMQRRENMSSSFGVKFGSILEMLTQFVFWLVHIFLGVFSVIYTCLVCGTSFRARKDVYLVCVYLD